MMYTTGKDSIRASKKSNILAPSKFIFAAILLISSSSGRNPENIISRPDYPAYDINNPDCEKNHCMDINQYRNNEELPAFLNRKTFNMHRLILKLNYYIENDELKKAEAIITNNIAINQIISEKKITTGYSVLINYYAARIYELKRSYSKAIKLYNNILENYKGKEEGLKQLCVKGIGISYLKRGDYTEGRHYLLSLLENNAYNMLSSPDIYDIYYGLGECYLETGQIEKACFYLDHLNTLTKISEQELAQKNILEARLNISKKSYSKAKKKLFRSLKYFMLHRKNNLEKLAEIHHLLGSVCFMENKYKKSQMYFKHSLLLTNNRYSTKRLKTMLMLARLHSFTKNYGQAEESIEEMIKIRPNLIQQKGNMTFFDPDNKRNLPLKLDFIYIKTLLEWERDGCISLTTKNLYKKYYDSFCHYESIAAVGDDPGLSDEFIRKHYEMAAKAAYYCRDTSWYFTIINKSKNNRHHYYKKNADTAGIINNTKANAHTEMSLHPLKAHSLTDLEKSQDIAPNLIGNIQERLDEQSLIIDYYIADDLLFINCFNKTSAKIVNVAINKGLEKIIEKHNINLAEVKSNNYIFSGALLHGALIGPLKEFAKEAKNIIIIPDKYLFSIPFETLIDLEYDSINMAKGIIPFILHKYAISYHYSLNELFCDQKRKQKSHNKTNFSGFAPFYSKTEPKDYYCKRSRKSNGLPFAFFEVEEINSMLSKRGLPTHMYSGCLCTEKQLRSSLKQSEIVHLACHCNENHGDQGMQMLLLNPGNSMTTNTNNTSYRKFPFSIMDSSINPGDDGLVSTAEINMMSSVTNLLVLSCCQSGFGKNTNIGPPSSLAHSFYKAGIKNILFTGWDVHDKICYMVMKSFYKHYLNGDTASKALKRAKEDLIREHQLHHPYFWAPFMMLNGTQNELCLNENH